MSAPPERETDKRRRVPAGRPRHRRPRQRRIMTLIRREGARVPSAAFQEWSTVRAASLDEVENAHRSVGGTGPGRRYATQQINQAYAVLLSSQFQAFCRDLHTECV